MALKGRNIQKKVSLRVRQYLKEKESREREGENCVLYVCEKDMKGEMKITKKQGKLNVDK